MTSLAVHLTIPHALRTSAADVAEFAQTVENLGFDGVFVGDHLAGAGPIPDSTVVLMAAATATTRISVGFGVMVLALRPTVWAAKQLATLQLLSGGRVILGVGTGGAVHGTSAWEAVGVPFEERGPRTDTALEVLRSLIAGEPTTLPGGAEITLSPGAEPPPIWIGGNGHNARRRAVRQGAVWFPSMLTPEQVASRPAGATIAVGGAFRVGDNTNHPSLVTHVAGLRVYGIEPDLARRLPLTGSGPEMAEAIEAFAAAGAEALVLGIIDGDDWRAQVEGLAEVLRGA